MCTALVLVAFVFGFLAGAAYIDGSMVRGWLSTWWEAAKSAWGWAVQIIRDLRGKEGGK